MARPGRSRFRAGRAGRTERDGRGDRQRRRPTALTGRAAILALVVCTLAISFAYPVRQYVEQRSQINALEEQRDAKAERVAELERAKRRWQDPAYIRAQARDRLHFVLPGETGYVAVGRGQHVPDAEPQDDRADVPADQQPWFTRLWSSVQDSGSAGAAARPEAGSRPR